MFDLFDLVDLADLALLMLLRVDWRSSRFLLIVRCKFLLLDDAALVVSHGCYEENEIP